MTKRYNAMADLERIAVHAEWCIQTSEIEITLGLLFAVLAASLKLWPLLVLATLVGLGGVYFRRRYAKLAEFARKTIADGQQDTHVIGGEG